MIRLSSIILYLAGIFSGEPDIITIKIDSQAGFESILERLHTELSNHPKELVFQFEKGTYFFDERMLCLDGMHFPETSLRFVGNGAVLTAKGKDYSNGDYFDSVLDSGTGITSGTKDVFVWSDIYFSDSRVKSVDRGQCLYNLKCKSLKKDMVCDLSQCYILLTEWYKSRMMKVHSIEDGSIVFIEEERASELNMDYDYARCFPRFKLLNCVNAPFSIQSGIVRVKRGLNSVHISEVGRFLTAYGASFKSISFEDFKFIGNRDRDLELMDFTRTMTEGITISDCEFCGLRSKLIQVAYTPDFTFSNNYVHDCYRGGINSFASTRTCVCNNRFHNTGLAMSNDFCITCAGEDFHVYGNKISNFGYGGIAVGMHYKEKRTCRLNGIVEYNELWYTRNYLKNYKEHTLMDSGAIYAYTQNDDTQIRNNFIHDYTGMKDNRGIFMDDGAINVTVRDNVIMRIANSWSIDSRRVADIENEPGSQVQKANIGNTITDNKTDGRIRFEKRK